mmetsp:Transcript_24581/g.50283  ORF Transcript_24581/g.50283 Transcript_24581/m.50283 type:complete len:795 (-) Transcript_24581:1222-3606(-)
MVASSRIVVVTNAVGGGVAGNGGAGIDNMILSQNNGLSPSSVIQSETSTAIHPNPLKTASATTTAANRISPSRRGAIEADLLQPRPGLASSGSNSSLRRVRSDNLAQSKREDPSVRRSIFGHYFKEKPRSYSDNHLVRKQPPPPPPSYTRSSSSESDASETSLSTPFPPQRNADQLGESGAHRHYNNNNHFSQNFLPVDYRVFAPSEQQVASSAICCRYRELNRNHQKDYDSLLERRVQVEHSLPPFPSPLRRFCSDTTATVAGSESYSSSFHSTSKNKTARDFYSSTGEMHYHGVYSLLIPISILKSGRYTNRRGNAYRARARPATVMEEPPSLPITGSRNNDNTTRAETEQNHPVPTTTLSSSFNFPRSYIENSAILKNLPGGPTDGGSIDSIGEEKKENDASFSSDTDPSSPFIAPDVLLTNNVIMSGASGLNASISATKTSDGDGKNNDCSINDSQRSLVPEDLEEQPRLRFDPRVTVTEFDDPIPRNWYQETELDQHKREAIVLAQSYLRKHPAVAGWYRQAVLDPVTKTYRKRALFSLPVFSSTYSSGDADPDMISSSKKGERQGNASSHAPKASLLQQQEKPYRPSVKKIMIVHPNPAIASLFGKSMKSMFPSAKMVTAGNSDRASRLIQASFDEDNGSSSPSSSGRRKGFDIVIVEQRLTTPPANNQQKAFHGIFDQDGPLGFLDLWKKAADNNTIAPSRTPPSSPAISYGSDLIRQVSQLSDSHDGSGATCLVIGVSVRPERDAEAMRRAGADLVWGIPIPSVGDTLRNKLLSKLLAKNQSSRQQ